MNGGDLSEVDADDLCTLDDSKLATAHSQTITFPPLLEQSLSRSQGIHLPCCVTAKGEKAPTFLAKLVVRPEAEGSNLCQAEVTFA